MQRYTVFLLIVVLLSLMLAAAGGAGAQNAPAASESEPNDTQATATPITLGHTNAALDPAGDVDYFKLSLSAGQAVYLAALADCRFIDLDTKLDVYDAGGNLLAEGESWPDHETIFNFVPPATADYFIRVVSEGYDWYPEQVVGEYTLWAITPPADEPNQYEENATPITWGASFLTTIYAPHDMDYYRIHARPGDVMHVTVSTAYLDEWNEIHLRINALDPDLQYSDWRVRYNEPGSVSITFVVPYETDYVIKPLSTYDQCEWYYPIAYSLSVERLALHVGAANAGTVDGVAFGTNDIMARNAAGQWQKVFDGEDVGITAALMGFEWTYDDELLLTLKSNQTLGALGVVKPQDILKFNPTRLGDNTQGTFSLYLRGAPAGLTTVSEKIDAIALLADDSLLISTTGSGSVPKQGGGSLGIRDEDLLRYHPNGPMPAAGTWTIDVDGSKILPRFGALDLRTATISDDYADPNLEPLYHHTHLWFGNDKPYEYGRYTVAPGDLLYMDYYDTGNNGWWWETSWDALTRQSLGFPKLITNLGIGY